MKLTRTILFTVIVAGLLTKEESYKKALSLLDNFNSHHSSVGEIQRLLEESAGQKYAPAYTKLGELWLFGLPVSPDNPSWNEGYVTDQGSFARKIPEATENFFKAAILGDHDAYFFMKFLSSQAKMLKEFESVPNSSDKHYSDYEKTKNIAEYKQCVNKQFVYVPSSLPEDLISFDSSDCGSCDKYIIDAISLGRSAVDYIQSQGAVSSVPDFLHEFEKLGSENTLKLYTKVSESTGDSEGILAAAGDYLNGNPDLNVERNVPEAIRLFEQAANQGNPLALNNLGVLYMQGVGVPANYTKAKEYLESAESLGSIEAMTGLGYMHMNGLGVPEDPEKAFEYLKKSADLGDVQSMTNLGVAYYNGIGTEENHDLAFKYVKAAAEMGHFNGIFNLALFYFQGVGTSKSCDKALKLLIEVIQQGKLGKLLWRAFSFYNLEDYTGAYMLYALAADLGFENAQINAAYMWENELVPFDKKISREMGARLYYIKAALSYQSSLAYLRLGHMAFYDTGLSSPNYEEAYSLYELALDYPEALFALAYMNMHGLGLVQNLDLAQFFYYMILDKVEQKKFDKESQYPTQAALALLWLKQSVGEISILGEIIDFLSLKLM